MVKSLTYWQIRSEIKSQDIHPVYIFAGEELFLKRQVEEMLKIRLFSKSSSEFNQDVFYGEEAGLDKVLDTLRTQPFLSDKRLVILKNAEKFSQHEKKLIEFLKNKNNNKNIFVLDTEKKLTDKFIKKIAAYARCVLFSQLEGADLTKWALEYAKKKGKNISSDAVALIIEKVGNDLESIINAVNKLCLYAAGKNKLTEADVDALITKTREDTRFMFLNALMSKQTQKALTMASELSRNGKHATDLIGLINWQFKRLDKLKTLERQGYSKDAVTKELKLTPYVYNIVRRQADKFTDRELEKGFELLLDSDVAIKQGLKSPGLTLETLIVRLCTNK
jgi:DNA polymerase-3 subunit delta